MIKLLILDVDGVLTVLHKEYNIDTKKRGEYV